MNFKPYTDKIDFMCCLGHTDNTPKEWCPKVNECQRAIAIRNHLLDEHQVVEQMCMTNVFEEFMG